MVTTHPGWLDKRYASCNRVSSRTEEGLGQPSQIDSVFASCAITVQGDHHELAFKPPRTGRHVPGPLDSGGQPAVELNNTLWYLGELDFDSSPTIELGELEKVGGVGGDGDGLGDVFRVGVGDCWPERWRGRRGHGRYSNGFRAR
jgi:hypothetical protein